MHHTFFDTPIIKTLLHYLAAFLLFCYGWKAIGPKPDHPKYVIIAAPHTSNWDMFFMLLIAMKLKIKIYWMGKDAIFNFPFRSIAMYMGGIPIDRSKANNVVNATIDVFNNSTELVVTVPPEGTRSHTVFWKTGFYHIATGAKVPICLGFLDFDKKEGGIGPMFFPSGDMDKDMIELKTHYSKIAGKYPDRFERVDD